MPGRRLYDWGVGKEFRTTNVTLVAAGAVEGFAVAHLAALFGGGVAADSAVGVDETFAVARGLQIHGFGVTEIAAIGNVDLIVTAHAQGHRRERVDAFMTGQAREGSDVLIVREAGERDGARLLDVWRGIVASGAHFWLREIIIFDARAFGHRGVASGAFQLQGQMRAVRKVGGRRGCEKRGER
jgi:hypothetical protein